MADINPKKVFLDIVAQIDEFSKTHQDEVFYAFALDAGLLCLNSIESFDVAIKKLQTDWDQNNSTPISRENLDEDEIEFIQFRYESEKDYHLKRNKQMPHPTFDEYLDHYIKIENSCKEDRKEQQNPYRLPEKIASLKWNTGDWAYQGFGEIFTQKKRPDTDSKMLNLDGLPDELTDIKILNSLIVKCLEKNSTIIFAQLNTTPDFRIFIFGHEY